MQNLLELAHRSYYGNSLGRYAEALGIFLILLTVLPLLRLTLARRLHALKPHQSPTALELSIALVEAPFARSMVSTSRASSSKRCVLNPMPK